MLPPLGSLSWSMRMDPLLVSGTATTSLQTERGIRRDGLRTKIFNDQTLTGLRTGQRWESYAVLGIDLLHSGSWGWAGASRVAGGRMVGCREGNSGKWLCSIRHSRVSMC